MQIDKLVIVSEQGTKKELKVMNTIQNKNWNRRYTAVWKNNTHYRINKQNSG